MNYKQILYIFYSLILGIFIGVESFTPKERQAHSSILIGTNLYFFGGVTFGISSNEVFYLDVSQTFNIASPPWTDLTISAKIPFTSSWAGMSLIDINNDPTVYLFGGIMKDPVSGNDKFTSIIHSFNIKTSEWKIPNTKGVTPARRRAAHAVSDNKGKLYIFGGGTDVPLGSPTTQYFNDMVILDATSLIWSYGSSLNAPTKRGGCSATLLTNGVIVYIGGSDGSNENDINQIYLYDTNLDSWSMTIAKNTNIIESRRSHSAVLAPDGSIIIYGGEKYGSIANTYASVEPDVVILNTQNTPFEWIVPTIPPSNVNNKPLSVSAHTANLVGNYMIVAFGCFVPSGTMCYLSSKVYIMDIRNYTWIDTFEAIQNEISPSTALTAISSTSPTALTATSSTSLSSHSPTALTPIPSTDNNDATKNAAVIGALSGILGTVFLSIIGFLGYKWHKKQGRKQDEILNIPGSI